VTQQGEWEIQTVVEDLRSLITCLPTHSLTISCCANGFKMISVSYILFYSLTGLDYLWEKRSTSGTDQGYFNGLSHCFQNQPGLENRSEDHSTLAPDRDGF